MAKRKNAPVESAGDKRIASQKATLDELLGDAPPITADEIRASVARPTNRPAGVNLSATPGGIGIYPNCAPINDVPHLIEWLEDVQRLVANSPRPDFLEHSRAVLQDGYRWRRFFTGSGSIPHLLAVTTVEEVESRLVDLIDDLKKGLPQTPATVVTLAPSNSELSGTAGKELLPALVEPVASPVADDDDKPDGMPSGERQILMENVIWTMGFRGIKTDNTKLEGKRLATFIQPNQKYNSALKTVLRQLRRPPYELLSPASGHGYFLNPKGVRVYEQLQKDRDKKSRQKKKSH